MLCNLYKLDFMGSLVDTCNPDIILGTETWLSEDVDSTEIAFFCLYNILHSDSVQSKGGGANIALKRTLLYDFLDVSSGLEILSVHVRL